MNAELRRLENQPGLVGSQGVSDPDNSFVARLEQRLLTMEVERLDVPVVRHRARLGGEAIGITTVVSVGAAAAVGIVVRGGVEAPTRDLVVPELTVPTSAMQQVQQPVPTVVPAHDDPAHHDPAHHDPAHHDEY